MRIISAEKAKSEAESKSEAEAKSKSEAKSEAEAKSEVKAQNETQSAKSLAKMTLRTAVKASMRTSGMCSATNTNYKCICSCSKLVPWCL